MNRLSEKILIDLGESVVSYWYKKPKNKSFNYHKLKNIRTKIVDNSNSSRNFTNAIYYLYSRKYVSFMGSVSSRKVVLTARGGLQYIKYCSLKGRKILSHNKKSMIITDVPEDKREIRDFLRKRLVKNGFRSAASNVYISDFSINRNFIFLVYLLGVKDFVTWGELLVHEDQ